MPSYNTNVAEEFAMKSIKESKEQLAIEHVTFDVVCGMEVDTAQSHHHIGYRNTIYYFCSVHCKQHFVNAPKRYVWGN